MSRQQDEVDALRVSLALLEDAAELIDKRREQNAHLAISLADAHERAIRVAAAGDLARAERDAARYELRVALGRLSKLYDLLVKVEVERDEARARATEWEVEAIRVKAARS